MDIISLSKAAKLSRLIDAYETGTIGSGSNAQFASVHLRINALEDDMSNNDVTKSVLIDFSLGTSNQMNASVNHQSMSLANNGSLLHLNGSHTSEIIDLGESFLSIGSFTVNHTNTTGSTISLSYQEADAKNDSVFSGSTWTLYSGSNPPSKRFLKVKWELTLGKTTGQLQSTFYDNTSAGNQFGTNEFLLMTSSIEMKKNYSVGSTKTTLGTGSQFSSTLNPSNFYGFFIVN